MMAIMLILKLSWILLNHDRLLIYINIPINLNLICDR